MPQPHREAHFVAARIGLSGFAGCRHWNFGSKWLKKLRIWKSWRRQRRKMCRWCWYPPENPLFQPVSRTDWSLSLTAYLSTEFWCHAGWDVILRKLYLIPSPDHVTSKFVSDPTTVLSNAFSPYKYLPFQVWHRFVSLWKAFRNTDFLHRQCLMVRSARPIWEPAMSTIAWNVSWYWLGKSMQCGSS